MKTPNQIRLKLRRLKSQLERKPVVENFGQKEVALLEKFIGDVYEFSYDERIENLNIIRDFDDWCMNYTRQ
jgi:hypothetical protein